MAPERRKAARRRGERRAGERRRDTLGPALEGITGAEVAQALLRADARIEIRCPAETKAEMEAVAGRHGLTLTAYLLRLHTLAVRHLEA
ncbi:MAG: hypothetical protein ACOCX4_07060 [Planctomycetota bacterium]